jgi:hypothetical protein
MFLKLTKNEADFLVDLIERECDLDDDLASEVYLKLKNVVAYEESDDCDEDTDDDFESTDDYLYQNDDEDKY